MVKITLEYGTNFVYSYVFPVHPESLMPICVEEVDRIMQSNTTRVSYFRGKKWRFQMSFPSIPQDMANMFRTIKGYPEPYRLTLEEIFPTGTYTVNWISNFAFQNRIPFVYSELRGDIVFEEV